MSQTKQLKAPSVISTGLGAARAPSLSGLGIDVAKFESVLSKMALDAIASGSPGNNPRKATLEDIIALYRKAL